MLGLIGARTFRARSAPSELSGRYERAHGLHLLRVSGDDYEMGYQHGALLREAVGRGPLGYFSSYVENLLATTLGRPLARVAATTLQHTVGPRIARGFPAHALDGLRGLADGAGLSRSFILRAVTMPESFLWVMQQAMSRRWLPPAPRHGVPLFGCTSALAWGDATRDGKLLHGRNFDYQGVGAWDTEQAMVFHRPKAGQTYVSISAAGILFGGGTAMNASGLSLVVHQHIASDSMMLGGTPIGIQGDTVMRHATNLEDARRILDDHTPNGCWTYIVASAKEARVLCYEVTPLGRRALFVDEGTFGYTNLFLDPELARSELHLYPSLWRHNVGRYHRAQARLREAQGDIDANTIASILGDPGDPACRFKDSISSLLTVASVVFQPEDGVVYVAQGPSPTSSRPFVALDLATESFRGDLEPLDGGCHTEPRASAAFAAYRKAYQSYFDQADLGAARKHLAEARSLQPKQALYSFVEALLALLDAEPTRAEAALDHALELGHPEPERVASFHLWRARARDVQGRRADALEDYRAVGAADSAVERAARRGQARPWRSKRFGIEFQCADVPMP